MNEEVFKFVQQFKSKQPKEQLELLHLRIRTAVLILNESTEESFIKRSRIHALIQEYMNLFCHIYSGRSAETFILYCRT